MKKFKTLLSSSFFWSHFIVYSLLVLVLEVFFMGIWEIPFVNYRVPFMSEITNLDIVYIIISSLLFGTAISIFSLMKKCVFLRV